LLRELERLVDRAGEEPLAERAKWNKADAELLQYRNDIRLTVPVPQGILALDGRDRLDGMGAADRLRSGLGEPEVLHLALGDEVFHRPGDIFDRRNRVDAVLVQQIDDIGAEAFERSLDGQPDTLRTAVDAA